MARIECFEDIQAWQKARELVRAVYSLSDIEKFKRDYGLRDQIRRAAVSVMANIAEGFARRTSKEFINFLGFAHGSIAETQSHLYAALDQSYIAKSDFDRIYIEAEEISKMLSGFGKYLKSIPSSKTSNS